MTGSHQKPITSSSLFMGIAEKDSRSILAEASRKRTPAGQVVISEGEKAERFFLLGSGRAKYYRLTRLGDEVLLWSLSSGDAFGLGSLLKHPLRYIGSAEATKDCEIYIWEHKVIRNLARKHSLLAENSLHIVLRYLAAHTDRLVSLITETAEQRLARALLHHAHRTGRVNALGVEVDATNEHMGALANVNPFTVSRLLKKWERSGIVAKKRGKILIHCPEKLVAD
jgi:CRP/FNR family transcriptional regulator, nitrogen oxide reductase regulator